MSDIFKNLHLQLSTEDINKIDAWKAKHGMKSRSEAIRSILRMVVDKDESLKSFNEKTDNDFLSPGRPDNNEIRDMIKNLVREEVNKLKE